MKMVVLWFKKEIVELIKLGFPVVSTEFLKAVTTKRLVGAEEPPKLQGFYEYMSTIH